MSSASQPQRIGKYEILSILGRGGMGVVYKARDPVIDRVVAIKTIVIGGAEGADSTLVERLHMEARSAGRLHHPNVVTVFDFGEQGELSYIVMEYVEGLNLARVIEEGRAIPLDVKLRILVQIAEGLAYAHENGVLHRDMKPSNVCVTTRGVAKLLDFGLARFDDTKLTKTGYMAGTIAYMSPERLSGESGVKDDIFALGAIAYELLTYQRAFSGGSVPEVMTKIISPDLPPAPSKVASTPQELDAIIAKALAKETADRYETAVQFADDIRRVSSSLNLPASRIADFFAPALQAGTAYVGPNSAATSQTAPTSRISVETPTEVASAPTLVNAPTQGETERSVPTAAAPTVIVPERKRRVLWPIAVTAVALIVIISAVVFLRRPLAITPAQPIAKAKESISDAPRDALADQTELQLATARTLSEELSRRSLSREDVLRFSDAKARMLVAEKRMNAKDYATASQLIANSMATLQSLMQSSSGSGEHAIDTAPARKTVPAVSAELQRPKSRVTVTAPPPHETLRPTPAAPVIEAPQPRPQPTSSTPTETKPAPTPVEAPEKQIGVFMRQLAAAYQSKDVGFFREHALHFSEQLANAIRNSPSVRVELQVLHIDVIDAQHANVRVKRTDWFGDPNAPPGTQALVYHLERDANGWQLASIGRE